MSVRYFVSVWEKSSSKQTYLAWEHEHRFFVKELLREIKIVLDACEHRGVHLNLSGHTSAVCTKALIKRSSAHRLTITYIAP